MALLVATLLVSPQFASAEEFPTVERASFPEDFVFGTATAAYQVCMSTKVARILVLKILMKSFVSSCIENHLLNFFLLVVYSTKALQEKVEKAQAYGIPLPTRLERLQGIQLETLLWISITDML